jgi:hypothetical protein
MSKKEKSVYALAGDFQAVIAMVPKLESFIKAHEEIAAGYQKYRKNGGASISGVEKHLGIKEQYVTPKKTNKTVKTTKAKVPKEAKSSKETVESAMAKKTKKKLNKS